MKAKAGLWIVAMLSSALMACAASPDGEVDEATDDAAVVNATDTIVLVQLEGDTLLRVKNPNGTIGTVDAQVQRFRDLAHATGHPLELVAASQLPVGKTFDAALDDVLGEVDALAKQSDAMAAKANKQPMHVSLAIAGHSNGMTFWKGGGATLSFDSLARAVTKHPAFAAHVTRLLLLGCNAGRQYWTDQWRAPFPNLVGTAGFNNTAPTATNGGNLFASGALSNLPDARPSAYQAQRTLNRLVAQGFSAGAFEVIDDAGAVHYASNVPPTKSNDAWDRIHELQPKYDCYFNAWAGCENPPADSDGNTVHDYYLATQDYVTALGQEGAPPSSFASWTKIVGQSLRLRRFLSDKRAYLSDPTNHARFAHLFPSSGHTIDWLGDVGTSRKQTLDFLATLSSTDADAVLLRRALRDLDPDVLPDNTID